MEVTQLPVFWYAIGMAALLSVCVTVHVFSAEFKAFFSAIWTLFKWIIYIVLGIALIALSIAFPWMWVVTGLIIFMLCGGFETTYTGTYNSKTVEQQELELENDLRRREIEELQEENNQIKWRMYDLEEKLAKDTEN